MVFLELRQDGWGSSRVAKGVSGNLSCASGKSGLLLSCEGERGIALKSLQRNQASTCIDGGISWFFSSCSRKLWVFLE